MEKIITTVVIARVQTMADGGLRFTFDAPETETLQAAQFMECKRFGVVGKLTFEAKEKAPEIEEDNYAGTIKRTKAKRRKPESDTSM